MKELRYQQKAVDELVSKTIDLMGLKGSRNALIFKSPTGSGKTVMASEMLGRLNQELTERPDAPFTQAAYIWIAPNKLHEQSYFKMKNRFTENCALHPVIFDELDHSADGYIKPGEILFVNWESINKDNNIMVRETEYMASLYDITRRTQCDYGINTANGKLAIWLSGEKTDNLDIIDRPNDPTEVLLFKQAIALGWDCPRAAVLLIFRKIESFQFSAQTVGRILRMPEQKYYTDQRLNQGYVYTNLSKDIIEIVKDDMNYLSTDPISRRRQGLHNIVLDSVYSERLSSDRNRLGTDFRQILLQTFTDEWNLKNSQLSLFTEDSLFGESDSAPDSADISKETAHNREAANNAVTIRWNVPYVSVDIVKDLEMTGEVGQRIVEGKASYINNTADLTAMFLAFCRKLLGNDYEQRSVKTLAGYLKEVMEELFDLFEYDAIKVILSNDNKTHNRSKFARVISKAIDKYTRRLRIRQAQAKYRAFRHYDWVVPAERAYSADRYVERTEIQAHALLPYMQSKPHILCSDTEHRFEAFLEENTDTIDWWYKNGDQGKAHFAIGYINSFGEPALFYVDYIIRMKNGDIFLFDTKTEDSDTEAVRKHNALLEYIARDDNKSKRLHGGIIIPDPFGNWVYSPWALDEKDGTRDTSDWVVFNPRQ